MAVFVVLVVVILFVLFKTRKTQAEIDAEASTVADLESLAAAAVPTKETALPVAEFEMPDAAKAEQGKKAADVEEGDDSAVACGCLAA